MTCFRVARPARQRWALLPLAVLAQAGEPSGGEDERGEWRTSSRLDLTTSSFYVDTRPKLGCHAPALNQQKAWLGKAAAFGACVSCNLVYRYIEHSGRQVPILGVLPKGEASKAGAEQECACSVGSSPYEDAHLQPTSAQHRAWLGSLLLALLAVAAVLGGGKGRRLSSHGRQTSGTCSVTLTPSARRRKESSHSTTDSTEFGHDSESDQEDDSPEPKQSRTAEAAARESVRRSAPSLPAAPAGAMRRQRTEPCAEDGEARRSRKASRGGGEPRAPRPRSTPGPKTRRAAAEVDKLTYGAGGFVRQKTEELEDRIGFYRMATEKSAQGEAEECQRPASGATFYRIGTENA